MAIKFQCDVCGGISDCCEHTHNIRLTYEQVDTPRLDRLKMNPAQISTFDGECYLELCTGCNDKIRKAINALILDARRNHEPKT